MTLLAIGGSLINVKSSKQMVSAIADAMDGKNFFLPPYSMLTFYPSA
jgi:hypothetical protein